jgi:hypothetical protein
MRREVIHRGFDEPDPIDVVPPAAATSPNVTKNTGAY